MEEKKTILSDRLYDVLKWLAILFLPALAILIKTIFGIWGIPYGGEIGDTIIALQVFLGAILGLSTLQYHGIQSNDKVTDDQQNSLHYKDFPPIDK